MPSLTFAKKMMWWTVLTVVTAVPLLISPSGKDAFRAPKEFLFSGLCLVLAWLLVVIVLRLPRLRLEALREVQPIVIVAAAAIAWATISTLFAGNRGLAVRSLLFAVTVALFVLVTWWLAREKDIRAAGIIAIPAAINAVIFLLQRFRIWDPLNVDVSLPEHFRYSALVGNPNDVASFFVAPALALVTLAIVDRPRRPRWSVASALVLAAVATGSLTAIGACAVGLFALAAMQSRSKAFAGAAIVVVALALVVAGFAPLRERLLRIRELIAAGQYAEAVSGRVTPFLAAAKMTRDHPVAGVGPGGFAWEYFPYKLVVEREHPRLVRAYAHRFNFGQTHNDHLQILAECGLVGYAIALTAFLMLARNSFRKPVNDSPRAEFARRLSLPLSLALFVLCLAHFPLHLAAPTVAFGFVAALCLAWSEPTPGAPAETTLRGRATPGDSTLRIKSKAASDSTVRVRRPKTAGDRWRTAAVMAAAAVTLAGIYRVMFLPYRCNIVKASVERTTTAAYDGPSFSAPATARANLRRLNACMPVAPSDVDLYMLIAANQRLLNRFDEAARTYSDALKYDRRPEIYFNLAMMELQVGRREDALRNFQRAIVFNYTLIDEIPYEEIRAEMRAILVRDYPYLAQMVVPSAG